MHFLYIDEAGSTGADLNVPQQPVFMMAGLVVSDEKWRRTKEAIHNVVDQYFAGAIPENFELHAHELLAPTGGGPFLDHPRMQRNELAVHLLALIEQRGHYILAVPIYKATLAHEQAPQRQWGFDWHHPWQFAFSAQMTMFEEYLRSAATGSTSTGLAIVDHEDGAVDFVRTHTAERQAATGWRQLKKVVEIGYSAASHANPMIQLVDLVAFTLKKSYELRTANAANWPNEARAFFEQCKTLIWSRVKYKQLCFTKLNVHNDLIAFVKAIRVPPA
jgi:hypothetical protein